MKALRIRVAIAQHVLGRLGPPLLAVVVYTVLATVLIRMEQARVGQPVRELHQTAYSLYTLLFFQPTDPFPATPIARAVFWLTPGVGALLIGKGLLEVGASLFDLSARRALWVRIVSEQMRDHIVVCGLGHVGYRVVEELHRLGEPIVALEKDETDTFVEAVRDLGIAVHLGDARRDELLRATGIAHARAVVCATNNDMVNVEVALDAKRMNPNIRVVMRMFDQRLARKVGGALELDELLDERAGRTVDRHPGVTPGFCRRTVSATPSGSPRRSPSARTAPARSPRPSRSPSPVASSDGATRRSDPKDAVSEGDRLIIDVQAADLERVRRALQ